MSVLTTEILIPRGRDEVFAFFSDAGNLEKLTPSWVNFRILTPRPIEMKVGALIEYRIRVRGVSFRWMTRISLWDPPRAFADDQIKGPYKVWRHQHVFEERPEGTLCRDIVKYQAPLAWLTHPLFVTRDVRKIFEFRKGVLLEQFQR